MLLAWAVSMEYMGRGGKGKEEGVGGKKAFSSSSSVRHSAECQHVS